MLRLWVEPVAQNLWVKEEEEAETEISTWERDEKDENPCLGGELSVKQMKEVREVLRRHVKVISGIPGNRVGTAQCGCGRSQAHSACTLPGSPVS